MSDDEDDSTKKQAAAAPLPRDLSLAKKAMDAALPDVSAKFAALAMPELSISKLVAQALPDMTSAKLEALTIPGATSRVLADALRIAQPDVLGEASKHFANVQDELASHRKLTLGLRDPVAEFIKSASATSISESIFKDIKLQQEALRSVIGPMVDMEKLLGTRSLIEASTVQLNLASIHAAALGPLADLRTSGILNSLAAALPATTQISKMLETYESRYRLPNLDEFAKLTAHLPRKSAFGGLYADEAMRAATMARSPWLEIEHNVKSAAAFTELQSLGQAIKHLEPFGSELLSGLRIDLGDWRDQINFPKNLYGDLSARSAFYIERGLRVDLAGFPAAAFEESLEAAELLPATFALVDLYGEPIEPADDEDSSAFTRTNRAHMWLMRLEVQIRQFIDLHLTRAFGPFWVKSQLVGDQYEKWQDKKKKAEAAGRPVVPLVQYADFTDYVLIICRRDNWKVFEPFFKDPANVRESFQRLALPRIETMHARPLSQEDELLLFAELKRLAKAIRS